MKFWSIQTSSKTLYSQTSSNDIEMTSYVMMTYVARDDVSSALPIMRWLTSKRNDLGGFYSTQDTVIAIQAMSLLAQLLVDDDKDLSIDISFTNFTKNLQITKENSIVYNRFDLPVTNGFVNVSTSGKGTAIAQLSICYNVEEEKKSESAFDCKLRVDDDDVSGSTLSQCCRLKEGESSTGMLLFEFHLLNGFEIDVEKELKQNPSAKKVEMIKQSANLYFDELKVGGEVCGSIRLKRKQMIAESKPSIVVTKDYYNPRRSLVQKYSVKSLSESTTCDVCGGRCSGCPLSLPLKPHNAANSIFKSFNQLTITEAASNPYLFVSPLFWFVKAVQILL